jgi:hypothetical protein
MWDFDHRFDWIIEMISRLMLRFLIEGWEKVIEWIIGEKDWDTVIVISMSYYDIDNFIELMSGIERKEVVFLRVKFNRVKMNRMIVLQESWEIWKTIDVKDLSSNEIE